MGREVVFKALTDATRQNILQLCLLQELSVSELVACLQLPQSTVSRHLKKLRQANLISDRRDGTMVLYSTNRGQSQAGDAVTLESRLLEWIAEQPWPRPLRSRLDRVLIGRQRQSTEFFSKLGHRWDQLRLDAFGSTFQFEGLLGLLPQHWVVADIGTGTGYLLGALSRAFRRVIALDPVENMLAIARTRCRLAGVDNVVFRQGDLSRLPIEDKCVDVAIAALVLHHVPSPEQAVKELFRIVRPGRRMLVIEQAAHRHEAFHERMQDRWWGFEPAQLTSDVVAAGFQNVVVRSLPTDPSPTAPFDSPELFMLTAVRPAENDNDNDLNID